MMMRLLTVMVVLLMNNFAFAQKADSLFEKRISAFTWMPDGNFIILNVLKIARDGKTPPVSKKFKYSIQSKTIELLPIDGGGLTVSPNGHSVAYIKQVNGTDQIYLYDFTKKEDKLLVNDTLKKYAISWSPDGKNLVYNIQTGRGANAKVEICRYHLPTNRITQITQSSAFKCYTPAWNLKNGIVYTAEKGDKRDQLYLTDKTGSFHTNLTKDTATHNYSPYWLNENTVIYIQAPGNIMTMKTDGSQKQAIEGITTTQFKYNPKTNSIICSDADENLILFNLKNKARKVLIEKNQVYVLFKDSYFDN